MLKIKTKWFNKWAKKNSISDEMLFKTIDDLSNNLNVANLGSGLFKVRTPKVGHGKSSGFRTIIVYKENDKAIFVYGFSKSEKENLDKEELKYFKKLASDLLQIKNEEYTKLIKSGSFVSLKEEI